MSLPYIYWLTDKKDAHILEKSIALDGLFNVVFFPNLNELLRQLAIARPDTIVFSTRASTDDTMSDINAVCRNPEAKGLKMILSVEKDDPKTVHLAASLCFRDILPLSITETAWLKRLKFATSSKSQKITAKATSGQPPQKAIIRAPSRINWIDKDRICVETSMFFDPGYKFTMLGPFAAFLGYRGLPLSVIERQSKRLRYRHSSSIICKIDTDELQGFDSSKLKSVSKGQSTSAPMNIYAVAKTQPGRQQIISAFGQHNVLFATKMVTAEKEVEFFEPDALIIEESFLKNKDIQKLIGSRLTCILSEPDVVPFLTQPNADVKSFKLVSEIHKYLQLKVPMNQRAKDAKWYIPETSDFSRCSVQFGASIERLSKDLLIVNSPNRARSYSIVEVSFTEDDSIQTSQYVKLCELIPAHDGQALSSFVSILLCPSSDVFINERQAAKVIEIGREKTKVNIDMASGADKTVEKVSPSSQIEPGHEFYEKEELRDIKIQYQKPSIYQNIVKSMDLKTVVQAAILTLVGVGLIVLLNSALKNPNEKMSGFSSWFSGRVGESGK